MDGGEAIGAAPVVADCELSALPLRAPTTRHGRPIRDANSVWIWPASRRGRELGSRRRAARRTNCSRYPGLIPQGGPRGGLAMVAGRRGMRAAWERATAGLAASEELIRYVRWCRPVHTATLGVDATAIQSSKRSAQRACDGERGYQPVLVLWAGQHVIVADQISATALFRRVPATGASTRRRSRRCPERSMNSASGASRPSTSTITWRGSTARRSPPRSQPT